MGCAGDVALAPLLLGAHVHGDRVTTGDLLARFFDREALLRRHTARLPRSPPSQSARRARAYHEAMATAPRLNPTEVAEIGSRLAENIRRAGQAPPPEGREVVGGLPPDR